MTARNDDGKFSREYELDGRYEELYQDYAEWVLRQVEKETTIERLRAGVRSWLYWCQTQNIDPYSADEDDVRLYIQDRQTTDADTTLSRRFSSVSKYYHYLITDPRSDAELEDNPCEEINLRRDYDIRQTSEYVRVLSRESRDDIIALPPDYIPQLADAVPGKNPETRTRNELIVRLLWNTAMRADELSRVRLRNLDFENREIRIRSAKLNPDDHPDLYNRRVWWDESLDYLLYRWKESHRPQLSRHADDSPYLFLTTHKEQMRPSHISRIVKQAGHDAGLQEPLTRADDDTVKQWLITAHRLRHSRISYLCNETSMDINFVRLMAGHAQIDTTLQYVQTDWESARREYQNRTQKTRSEK